MNENQLTIGYHPVSSIGLDDSDTQELVNLLGRNNIEAETLPFPVKREGLPVASIIPEPNKLIITLNGILASQPMLADIARNIFLYFERNWKRIQEEKRVEHFAVIVDVTVNGNRQYVGIDFKDEQTLAINCYRLSQYLSTPHPGKSGNELIELEYPKKSGSIWLYLAILSVGTFVISTLILLSWSILKIENAAMYHAFEVASIVGMIAMAVSSFTYTVVGSAASNQPIKPTHKFIVENKDKAYAWATTIDPQFPASSTPQINVQIVNNPAQQTATKIKPIKILFLASNPKDTSHLRLDEEIRSIDEVLQKSEFRDRFQLEKHFAVRVSDLQNHLLRYKPDIVHFSGHGTNKSEVVLEDEQGHSQAVSQRALSQLFNLLKDNIRCVVLNACYSESQARAIAEHIECVVGMSIAIGDDAAIRFARAFYQALGYGRDIKTAFDLGCLQIDMEGLGEEDTPKLLADREDPSAIFILQGIR